MKTQNDLRKEYEQLTGKSPEDHIPDTGKEIDHSGDTNKMILDILIDVQTYELSQTEGVDRINIMIKEAETKAFEAGFHKGLAMSDKDFIDVENEYNKWKEANQ